MAAGNPEGDLRNAARAVRGPCVASAIAWLALAVPAVADTTVRIGCERVGLVLAPPVTPAIVDRDWGTGEPHKEPPARLILYGCSGNRLDQLILAAPLAKLNTQPIGNPLGPTLLVSADLSAGFGSYSGPLTLLVQIRHDHLAVVEAKDAGGHSSPIRLVAALKSAWQETQGPSGIKFLAVNSEPDFGADPSHWSGDFVTNYRTFYFSPAGWQVRTLSEPGIWEADRPFPPRSKFPG